MGETGVVCGVKPQCKATIKFPDRARCGRFGGSSAAITVCNYSLGGPQVAVTTINAAFGR